MSIAFVFPNIPKTPNCFLRCSQGPLSRLVAAEAGPEAEVPS